MIVVATKTLLRQIRSPIFNRSASFTQVFDHHRHYCQQIAVKTSDESKGVNIKGVTYSRDNWTNVSEKLLVHVDRSLHNLQHHPLNFVKQKIINFFYSKFLNSRGNPLFSIYDNFSPVVTTKQNFDDLLIPSNHPSRRKCDTYYINRDYVLRSQTSAHQQQLIRTGLDNFLFIGDVYRKDEIDAEHYPVFHQVEGVRLRSRDHLFKNNRQDDSLRLFENLGIRTPEKQEVHTLEAVKLMEHELKTTLVELVQHLFGHNTEYKWVETYFPFTHPSFELEVNLKGKWMELLGCGIMEHRLLQTSGAGDKIGWAFGIGLERLAMVAYEIPDIRLFWSKDSGFLNQFKVDDSKTPIKYKPISVFPQCTNDMSFWLPDNFELISNEFYDLVRRIGGDIIEQVSLFDEFRHPKTGRKSQCYRIVYRHMEKTLTQNEVNQIHTQIGHTASKEFGVELR